MNMNMNYKEQDNINTNKHSEVQMNGFFEQLTLSFLEAGLPARAPLPSSPSFPAVSTPRFLGIWELSVERDGVSFGSAKVNSKKLFIQGTNCKYSKYSCWWIYHKNKWQHLSFFSPLINHDFNFYTISLLKYEVLCSFYLIS